MANWIFVPSIPSTGTWFVVHMLANHPAINGWTMLQELVAIAGGAEGTAQKCHTGVPGDLIEPSLSEGTNVIQRHVALVDCSWAKLSDEMIGMLASLPCLIPLRDPLLSLITQYQKAPQRDHSADVIVWRPFVEVLLKIERVANLSFLPLDVLDTHESRLIHLMAVFNTLQIPNDDFAADWADQWPTTYNSRGDYVMKQKYYARDIGYLSRTLGDAWTELQRGEEILRPFLERHGYKKLLWWSDNK